MLENAPFFQGFSIPPQCRKKLWLLRIRQPPRSLKPLDWRSRTAMASTQSWKAFFTDWPTDFPRCGILVSTLNEVVPFRRFWLKGDLLLLERSVPDASGGRFLLLAFEVVNSVKFVNPLTEAAIGEAGFVECGDASLLHSV